MAKIFAIFILIFLCSSSYAQELNIGEMRTLFTVDEIKVEGTKKVEPEAIIEKLETKVGTKLTNYALRSDIQKIYDMKYFDVVEAHQEVINKKNVLLIKVKEKPIIAKVVFEGNDEVSSDDLKEQIKTKEYNILDVNTIKGDLLLLQNFYEEKGFYLATTDYELKKAQGDGLDLIFKIKEYDKVTVKKITFLGNNEVPDDELKKFMQTQEETLFSGLSGSGNFKEFNFQTDIERLKYIYKSKGYLQVNIGNPTTTVSEDKKWIFITIKVTEGPKFDVNNIYFNGELLFTDAELRADLDLKSGDVYSEEKLRLDIQKLTEMYQDKGYAFANVLRTLQIVPGENKVENFA